jgi:acetolactate synthase-1/2/3 large subunit|tara:strand:- start:1759 stop:3531 length:1773 start_codon:yes stop_codon:yes gene_type:complete
MIRLADYVINFLEEKKIETVFTVSGGGSIFLCDALYKAKKLKYISCHHEQAAAYAAEGYARQKNSIGCSIVTTGPGGTNAVSGVSCCWVDSIPMVFISGQVYLDQTVSNTGIRQIGVQETNIIPIVESNTKFSVIIQNPNTIRYNLEKAFYIAQEGRPGPVWIDIPANIQNSLIDLSKLRPFKSNKKKSYNLDQKIKSIAKLIYQSKKPLIHFGHGARISNADKICKKFINKHKIPFALTWNASDFIENNHPLFAGKPGAFAERGSNFIVQSSDLYISIGSRLPFMVTGYNSKDFARNAKKIMIDIDEKELNKNNSSFIDILIQCDAKVFMTKLYNFMKVIKKENFNWNNYCRSIRNKFPIIEKSYKHQKKVNSYYFIQELSKALDNKSTIVTDMGLSFVGTHQAFKVKKNQKLFTNSGHAPMGWGLPASIGAYFSNKNRNTICLTGEGGIQMNIQELATIKHHKIPIKIFIYNNGGYLTIKQTQQHGFNGRIMGSDKSSGISFPDYKKISEAHEIDYIKIENNTNLDKKIKSILKNKKPLICELFMDHNQDQKPKAINKRLPNGKTIPTTFEDMYPFLEENTIKENLYE